MRSPLRLLRPTCGLVVISAFLGACACGASGAESPPPTPAPPPPPPAPPRYEVHEWGLVRGTMNDRLMISGPHAPEPVQVVTKPLLFFHRLDEGDAPLVVDVQVTIPDGRIVEHWPMTGPVAPSAWTIFAAVSRSLQTRKPARHAVISTPCSHFFTSVRAPACTKRRPSVPIASS